MSETHPEAYRNIAEQALREAHDLFEALHALKRERNKPHADETPAGPTQTSVRRQVLIYSIQVTELAAVQAMDKAVQMWQNYRVLVPQQTGPSS
jgi:hypothetical protein